ncbi:MAG: ATP-binding protein [Fibrobacteres bacterium]|nr:ATP-binding protein [Fibrobacterota bacterium]
MERAQTTAIIKDLQKKMVFLVGPRQSGKTWLAKHIATKFKSPVYLNYDRLEDRKIIENGSWPLSTDLCILDEIHKMENWKNHLKGLYDTKPETMNFLVTGSARLNAFRQVGDSMAGRYFLHHLMPFSLSELPNPSIDTMERLIQRGGFPEPFLSEDETDAERWRLHYIDGLIRTDILDFEKIHDFKAIQLVLELLRRRVGSPISYTSIAEDAHISANTVKRYIEIFEALFIVFRVTPFANNIARSLVKEPKIYFHDTGMVIGDTGPRFENFAACSLLKYTMGVTDYQGIPTRLHYLRTLDGREVDFCIVQNEEPTIMLEAKHSESRPDKHLIHFNERYSLRGIQLVRELRQEWQKENISVLRADNFLAKLAFQTSVSELI